MCTEFCVEVKIVNKASYSAKLSNQYSVLQHEFTIELG